MVQQSAGLPSRDDVAALLGADFARAGFEIDAVVVDAHRRPPRITVVADGDDALTLEAVAELSRAASALLDAVPGIPEDYVLEVSSPGVERPLTAPKHFLRARGRRADLTLTDGSVLSGRIGALSDRTLALVVGTRGSPTVRSVSLDDVVSGAVQVEFVAPGARELELAGVAGEEEPR